MAHSLEAVSLDKLKSFLVCSICLETVTNPRTLPCFHSYCQPCLESFVKNHRDKMVLGRQVKQFNCPMCRNMFTLNPEERVADMTQNHFILNMLEVMAVDQHRVKGVPCSHNCEGLASIGRCLNCEVFLCQKCLTMHNKYPGFKDHSVLSMDELSKPENQAKVRGKLHCQEHDNKTLKFYCETCQELICRYCMEFKHGKLNHSCLPVGIIAQKEKRALVASFRVLEARLTESKKAVEEISDVKQSLQKVQEQTKRDINQRKDKILEAVTQKVNKEAEDLIGQVDELYVTKQNILVQQENEAKSYVEKLESYVNLSRGLVDRGTDEEIVSSAKTMKSTIEKLHTECHEKVASDINYQWVCDPIDNSKISTISEQMGKIMKKERVISSSEAVKDKTTNANTFECPICLDVMTNPKMLNKCNHSFCTECIEGVFKYQRKCPLCDEVYGVLTGNQPPGKMWFKTASYSLPGYNRCGTITIFYDFPNGTQASNHPNPGQRYSGTSRTTFLPDNKTGRKVLKLLKKAFDQNLTFTIGRSSTTGAENVVTWNDIHHKTNTHGGPTRYGYPDPEYLTRLQDELAAKGITE